MKTLSFKLSLLALLFSAAVFTSCNRDDDNGSDAEEDETIQNASIGEDATDDAIEIGYQTEVNLKNSGGRTAASCPAVSIDKSAKKIVIDFGDGCTGPYGRTRKGKIIIAYSGEIGDSLANRIITFEGYSVNNKGITGTIELRDQSINNAGYLQSTKRVTDLTVTWPSGKTIVYNGSRTREWMSGRGDGDPSNNIYRITGSMTGLSSTGRSFTHEITTPIISDWSCAADGGFARVSGIVEMTRLNGYVSRKRTVDYGDGTCDNVITITTVRKQYTVTVE